MAEGLDFFYGASSEMSGTLEVEGLPMDSMALADSHGQPFADQFGRDVQILLTINKPRSS